MSMLPFHPDHCGFSLTDQLQPALERTFVRKQHHKLTGAINPHDFLSPHVLRRRALRRLVFLYFL